MYKVVEYQYITSLIVKEQFAALSEVEKEELALWLAENEQHRLLYEHIRQKNMKDEIRRYRKLDPRMGLKKYHKRYRSRKNKLFYYWSAAAVVCLFLGTGILIWQDKQEKTDDLLAIHPGSAQAELVLSDGSVHPLEQLQAESIALDEIVIQNTGACLEYIHQNSESSDTVSSYHELRIPTGGEYQLVMADGTRVWLNSQTHLRFPTSFKEKERRVYLEGEAYFEVAHDQKHPFIVCTQEQVEVKVLGTSFNVRAYADEGKMETVLEEGAVQVRKLDRELVLHPGMKAMYNYSEDRLTAEKVDTELFTAWRKGHFVFQDETLENILHHLSRWYGMTVFYANEEVKQLIYSGDIRKYDTIQNLLEVMEISGGVRFEIKGNTLLVYGDE